MSSPSPQAHSISVKDPEEEAATNFYRIVSREVASVWSGRHVYFMEHAILWDFSKVYRSIVGMRLVARVVHSDWCVMASSPLQENWPRREGTIFCYGSKMLRRRTTVLPQPAIVPRDFGQ